MFLYILGNIVELCLGTILGMVLYRDHTDGGLYIIKYPFIICVCWVICTFSHNRERDEFVCVFT